LYNSCRFYVLQTDCQKAELFECFLRKGADPNVADVKGNTIAHGLFMEAQRGKQDNAVQNITGQLDNDIAVATLLSYKANFLKENHEGKTPIDLIGHSIEHWQLYEVTLQSRHLASLEDCFNLEFTSDLCVMLNQNPEKYFVHHAVLQSRCPKLASHFKGRE
jgi:hypothetical protein